MTIILFLLIALCWIATITVWINSVAYASGDMVTISDHVFVGQTLSITAMIYSQSCE
jgi:hypothetical protein